MTAQSEPSPVLGMCRRTRSNGATFLAAIVDADLVLPAGCELHVRRMHDGNLPSPEFALQVIPPAAATSRRVLDRAAADRLDGSGLRRHQHPAPAADSTANDHQAAEAATQQSDR